MSRCIVKQPSHMCMTSLAQVHAEPGAGSGAACGPAFWHQIAACAGHGIQSGSTWRRQPWWPQQRAEQRSKVAGRAAKRPPLAVTKRSRQPCRRQQAKRRRCCHPGTPQQRCRHGRHGHQAACRPANSKLSGGEGCCRRQRRQAQGARRSGHRCQQPGAAGSLTLVQGAVQQRPSHAGVRAGTRGIQRH